MSLQLELGVVCLHYMSAWIQCQVIGERVVCVERLLAVRKEEDLSDRTVSGVSLSDESGEGVEGNELLRTVVALNLDLVDGRRVERLVD